MGIDVSLYLSHLLYRNNVAILPSFGAFVATTTPAVIDLARGIISPPSKILTFNENLKINDGFLINLIRHKHGITAHEARAIVDNFVTSMNDILKNKDTVRLDSIGKLYVNNNRQIVFEPDTKANFNATTFGLPAIQYHPLSRNIAYIKPTEKPVNIPQPTESTATTITETPVEAPIIAPLFPTETIPAWYANRRFLTAAAIIGFTATAALWYAKQPKANAGHEARTIPTEVRVNVKPGQEINTETTDNQDITTSAVAENATSSTEKTPVIEEQKPITPVQEEQYETPAVKPEKQFEATLLIGSYSKKSNIKRVERRLRRKGYQLYSVPFNGLRRVGAIVHFNTPAEKKRHISRLQKIFGKTVWELEK